MARTDFSAALPERWFFTAPYGRPVKLMVDSVATRKGSTVDWLHAHGSNSNLRFSGQYHRPTCLGQAAHIDFGVAVHGLAGVKPPF